MSSQAGTKKTPRSRAFRGLLLMFIFSLVNLAGISFSIMAIGGFGEWTVMQFIGFYGIVEAGSGLSSVLLADVWRLPVAQQETSRRTSVRLALSTLRPRWGSIARLVAGTIFIGAAVATEGAAVAASWTPLLVLDVAVLFFAVSAIAARAGVARPDLDVMQFVVRWRKREDELPPLSLSASIVQFFLSILTLPAVKLLKVSALYSPQFGPSTELVAGLTLATVMAAGVMLVAWRGRMGIEAPREQQREAEANA